MSQDRVREFLIEGTILAVTTGSLAWILRVNLHCLLKLLHLVGIE